MSALWFILAVIVAALIVGVSIFRKKHKAMLANKRMIAKDKGYTDEQINEALADEVDPLPGRTNTVLGGILAVFMGLGLWNNIFFYAEPGYVYHVRTIFGEERVIDSVGYSYHLFGRYNAWKKAMTVQAVRNGGGVSSDAVQAENDSTSASANLPGVNIMFLDQVDANAFATARFRIPTDKETFLKMAHEYRTPTNLLRTALIPSFRETLHANASLMSAEEYYSGSRTQFNNEFEIQMQQGIYIVKRKEVRIADTTSKQEASANASKGDKQDEYGDGTKVVFKVEKEYDSSGQPLRKKQKFLDYGITVVEARITDLLPNDKFVQRMQLKQKASADRAIAREQRIQEEEQKLLAEAKGKREVAERQAKAKVEQIEKTTNAETDKQLAITEASKKLEYAKIEKQTAEIQLERDQVKAKSVKVLADADAYKKKQILQADNALAQKLQTEVEIHKVWAQAYATRKVPQYVFGGSGSDGVPTGGDQETKRFMQLMTIDAAKRLSYDRGLGEQGKK